LNRSRDPEIGRRDREELLEAPSENVLEIRPAPRQVLSLDQEAANPMGGNNYGRTTITLDRILKRSQEGRQALHIYTLKAGRSQFDQTLGRVNGATPVPLLAIPVHNDHCLAIQTPDSVRWGG